MSAAREASRADAGVLTVVATPIGNLGDLAPRAVAALASADLLYCEDTRHTGKLLKAAGIDPPKLVSLHGHNENERLAQALAYLDAGRSLVIVSDAGMPVVADPGSRLVDAVLSAGHRVSVVPGPSALTAAVAVSGLVRDRFAFEGFLPTKGAERAALLAEIAAARRPSVLFEAPHRIARTVQDLHDACGKQRVVALCRELTKLHEEVWRGPLGEVLSHPSVREPRGEYVLVVAGAEEVEDLGDETVRAWLVRLGAAGLSRRDAISALEVLCDVPHRRAYHLALDLERD